MTPPHPIHIARVYDAPGDTSGARLLIDRLWPRGVAKADLPLDDWPKEATPGTELRKWFHANTDRWPEFRRRYLDQLRDNPETLETTLAWCRKGPVTLLTAARDPAHSHAVVLRDHLTDLLTQGAPR